MKKNFLLLLVVASVGQVFASQELLSPVAEVDAEGALVELAPAAPAALPDTVSDQLSALQLASLVEGAAVQAEVTEVVAADDADDADDDVTVVSKEEEISA